MFDNLSLFFAKRMSRINDNVIRLDGMRLPSTLPRHSKKIIKNSFRYKNSLTKDVEINVGQSHYRFRCGNWLEFKRCMTLLIKEPGTCDWIRKFVAGGSVFYDVGSNIGIYSILAAERVGESGKVFAFEPHAANFSRLLENIRANHLQDIVKACAFALHEKNGFFPFDYVSGETGSSNSQLCCISRGTTAENQTYASEIKNAVSIDYLISSGGFPPPDNVKIDVDGNEFLILRGMSNLLKSSSRPKSVQVEISKSERTPILSFMKDNNYRLLNEHCSIYVTELIAEGQSPAELVSNMIFVPKNQAASLSV